MSDNNQPVVPSDIEIARNAEKLPVAAIAEILNIPVADIEPYGHDKAKITMDFVNSLEGKPEGKLILVSAINPTPAGEGKTTTTIGLADALQRIGKKSIICLREPSLGPCFGMKGGAAGGGYSQVVPMEDINLHFTGDFHAIGLAHNLLSAAIDNHLHQGNALNIDPRQITWKRVIDMNDRALRNVNIGLGGTAHSIPRESGFDITVASEVMAILCLAGGLQELKEKIGQIQIGFTYEGAPVLASDLNVHGAMTVLLKDAIKPNLVQSLEHTPALIHGGPFANIAHGCSSVMATKLGLKLADYTVTEAGFGADLGAEKFVDIKCRNAGLQPNAVVIVATVRALKCHGGVARADLGAENVDAVLAGIDNLRKHIENVQNFKLPVVVALNRFITDTDAEIACVQDQCDSLGVSVIACNNWAEGGKGAEALATEVVRLAEGEQQKMQMLYTDQTPLWEKVRTIAQKIYGAADITGDAKLKKKFQQIEDAGYGHLPICMAKTQYSLSGDPTLVGRPEGFTVNLSDVKLAAGAGFVVVLTANVLTMPGLPRNPAAEIIDIDENGQVVGLF